MNVKQQPFSVEKTSTKKNVDASCRQRNEKKRNKQKKHYKKKAIELSIFIQSPHVKWHVIVFDSKEKSHTFIK